MVRWGSSVLMSKRISPPRSMPLSGGVGRLELKDGALAVIAGPKRVAVTRGQRVRTEFDDVEIVVDATEDSAHAFAVPVVYEKRHVAADMGSFAFHGVIAGILIALHAPISDEATSNTSELASMLADSRPSTPQNLVLGLAGPASMTGDETAESSVDEARASAERSRARQIGGARTKPKPAAATRAAMGMVKGVDVESDIDCSLMLMSDVLNAAHEHGPVEAQSPWSHELGYEDPRFEDLDRTDAFSAGGLELSTFGDGSGRGAGATGWAVQDHLGTIGGARAGVELDIGNGLDRGDLAAHRVSAPTVCGQRARDAKVDPTDCSATVQGRLPPEVIQRTIRQSFGRLRHCYELDKLGKSRNEERSVARFVIGRDGAVSTSQASGSSSASLDACVAGVMRNLSFPQPEGGVVSVTYPVVFYGGD